MSSTRVQRRLKTLPAVGTQPAADVTPRLPHAGLKILVLAFLFGYEAIHKSATSPVPSKSYQEALTVFRASPAYQWAAAELLEREAKWIAEQVNVKEPISCDPDGIGTPNYGINGSVCGSNYLFSFSNGRFQKVRWSDWARKMNPPLTDLLEFSQRPSQLDKEGAKELAWTWLKDLEVDLAALAAKSSRPSVFQVPASSIRETGPGQPRAMCPQFIVTWPGQTKTTLPGGLPIPTTIRPLPVNDLVKVEILGTTKQLIELRINDPKLWTRPPLELKNAFELLGPDLSPAELMAKILTPKSYDTIAHADLIEAWLLTSNRENRPKKDRTGPLKLKPGLARKFSAALLDIDSFNSWSASKGCITDDGARLRFRCGAEEVRISFCFECDILTINHAGSERGLNFDNSHNHFANLILEAFPDDAVIRDIPRKSQ